MSKAIVDFIGFCIGGIIAYVKAIFTETIIAVLGKFKILEELFYSECVKNLSKNFSSVRLRINPDELSPPGA